MREPKGKTMDNKLTEELAQTMRKHASDLPYSTRLGLSSACIPIINRLIADAREAGARAALEVAADGWCEDCDDWEGEDIEAIIRAIDPAQFREPR